MQKTNEENSNPKEEFNRHWALYGSLAGLCSAFLISLFDSEEKITSCSFLYFSTGLFSFLLPIFSSFSIFHFIYSSSNQEFDKNKMDRFLESNITNALTIITLFLFFISIALYISHFNTVFGSIFTLCSVTMTIILIKLITHLKI